MTIPGAESPFSAARGLLRQRPDPYLPCNFMVVIEGLAVGGFSQVDGLEREIQYEEIVEGGVNDRVHLLAGPSKAAPLLVLRKGLTDFHVMWQWFDQARRGKIVRRNGSVILLDSQHRPAAWWDFKHAYPVKWSGPALAADAGGQVAVETVELAHDGIERPKASLDLAKARTGLAAGKGAMGGFRF